MSPDDVPLSSLAHDNGPTGVGGWLLFLCVSLAVLGPLATALNLVVGLRDGLPLVGQVPRWGILLIIDTTLSLLILALSLFSGVRMWRAVPRAHRWGVATLTAAVLYQVLIIVMVPAFRFPTEFEIAIRDELLPDAGRSLVVSAIWLFYLSHSKRVRNTYSQSSYQRLTDTLPSLLGDGREGGPDESRLGPPAEAQRATATVNTRVPDRPPAPLFHAAALLGVVLTLGAFDLLAQSEAAAQLPFSSPAAWGAGAAIAVVLVALMMRRHSLARLLLAGFLLTDIPLTIPIVMQLMEIDLFVAVTTIIELALHLPILVLLFTPANNQWFSAASPAK